MLIGVISRSWVFLYPFPLKNFSADTLISTMLKNKQKRTTEYENHKTVRIKNSQLQSKIYCFILNTKKSVLALSSNISLFDLLFCSFILIKNSV